MRFRIISIGPDFKDLNCLVPFSHLFLLFMGCESPVIHIYSGRVNRYRSTLVGNVPFSYLNSRIVHSTKIRPTIKICMNKMFTILRLICHPMKKKMKIKFCKNLYLGLRGSPRTPNRLPIREALLFMIAAGLSIQGSTKQA